MAEEKAEAKKEKVVEMTEVVTQTAQAFKLPNGEVVGMNELLVWIANSIVEIKRKIA